MIQAINSPQQAASPPFGERNVDVLGRNNVHVSGEGELTLVLVNGFGCNQHVWRYVTPALAKHYQLILFDHVGSGESDLAAYEPDKYATLDGYAQDLVEICRSLRLRNAVLVGHSAGAMIAMLAAIKAPECFAKLVMLAPSPCYLNKPDYYGGFEAEDVHQLLDLMEVDYNSWANLFANLLMGPTNPTSLGMELAGYFCNTDSTIAKQFARTTFLADNRTDVSRLILPTLLLQCTQDVVAPQEVGEFLRGRLANAKLVQLRATGHCPHLSAPLEALAAIEEFLF